MWHVGTEAAVAAAEADTSVDVVVTLANGDEICNGGANNNGNGGGTHSGSDSGSGSSSGRNGNCGMQEQRQQWQRRWWRCNGRPGQIVAKQPLILVDRFT